MGAVGGGGGWVRAASALASRRCKGAPSPKALQSALRLPVLTLPPLALPCAGREPADLLARISAVSTFPLLPLSWVLLPPFVPSSAGPEPTDRWARASANNTLLPS